MESFFPGELILLQIEEVSKRPVPYGPLPKLFRSEDEIECCGTCDNNTLVMAEMGICKVKETCFCKGKTSGVTDFWDNCCDSYIKKPL